MVTFYGIEKASAEGTLSAHLCRWCLARQVQSKGDICHVCADGVEFAGLQFKSDKSFPWLRITAMIIGFGVSIAILTFLTK